MRYISFSFFIFLSFAIFAQQESSGKELITQLKNGAAIVRLYMNKPKVDMLQKSIKDERSDASSKIALQKMLDDHIIDRKAYVQKVIAAFNEHYTFSKVYFMYDYDQKKLKDGHKSGFFLNAVGEYDASITLTEEHFLIFGRGVNDKTIVISQLSGQAMPTEFPTTYNRNVIGVFKYMFVRDKLGPFVEKLSEKLESYYKKVIVD